MKYENIIREVPAELLNECECKGKVERIDYKTTDRFEEAQDKYAFVYTPYGYDPQKKYEIMYLIHGGGESAEKYLYQDGENNPLKRIVDNLIYTQEIKETIIVTPSWYPHNDRVNKGTPDEGRLNTQHFPVELVDLMKAVESTYSTFAPSCDDEGFRASRDHRCVAGWSMGSCTTWFVFTKHIGYFNRFGNMSCDSWVIEVEGGKTKTCETAEILANSVKEQGIKKEDFFLYVITGTKDHTFDEVAPLVSALKAYPELFEFEGKNQNASFLVWLDGEHHTQWRLQYTYNVIRNFLG